MVTPPQAREKFSHYRIRKKLGQGGVGEVYLADDQFLGRKVALKFLTEDSRRDQGTSRRFIGEARAAAAIDHPFVCKIYESGEFEGQPFIAMEYVEGQTLDLWLRSSPVFDARVHAAREIAEALEKAHSKGFIHRDLKPTNIMLTRENHVKVMDFGLARQLPGDQEDLTLTSTDTALTKTGQIAGTLAYMSPEQVKGDSLDYRSDIFSFGIILYEMFAGIHPFKRDTAIHSVAAILHERIPKIRHHLPDCPPGLEQAIERMLAKDPSARYQSMAAVRQDLSLTAHPPAAARASKAEHNSVAVLPFTSLSSDREDEYFSDGMTEEIITRISKIGSLKVISRTSVMRFKHTDKELRAIGSELGVETIVEGSVRRASNKLRITGRLVSVESESQIWSEVYDRDLEDIFAIQTDVSREIANALQRELSSTTLERMAPVHSQNLEAYNDYLKGRYFLNKLTPEGISRGIRHFRSALDTDPTYALAYAGLSTCHAYAGHFSYAPLGEAFPLAKAAAQQALSLDDSLSEACASMALVALFYEWDWDNSALFFQRALEIDPNYAAAHLHYSWYLFAVGQHEHAIEEAVKALELDPLSPFSYVNLGWAYFFSRQYDESIDQYEKALQMEPDYVLASDVLAGSYLAKGMFQEAIRLLEARATSPTHLGWAYAMAGMRRKAERVIAKVTDPSEKSTHSPLDIALIYLLLGDRDEGFRHLEAAFQQKDSKLIYVREHPYLEDFRSDPRMIDIFRRMGLCHEAVS